MTESASPGSTMIDFWAPKVWLKTGGISAVSYLRKTSNSGSTRTFSSFDINCYFIILQAKSLFFWQENKKNVAPPIGTNTENFSMSVFVPISG